MARAVIHTGSFLSRAGVTWRVDIWEEGYTDQQAALLVPGELDFPADEPLVIEWDERDKEEVVCGSSCSVRVISPGDRTYAALYSTEVAAIGVNVWRNNVLHWTGTLDPCQYEEPYERAWGYDVLLTFQDFGSWDRLRYNLSGMQKMSDILADAVSRSGLSAATVDYTSLVSSLHVPVENSTAAAYTGSSVSTDDTIYSADGSGFLRPVVPSGDIVSGAEVNNTLSATGPATIDTLAVLSSNFYDDGDEGKTLAEVVEAMLQPMGMRVIQRGGVVWVYDLNGLAAAAALPEPREDIEPIFTVTARRRILSDGTIGTGSSWSYTAPIHLLAGDILTFTCSGYNSATTAVLSLTDRDASSYTMIYDGTGQPSQGTAMERTYTAERECWVAICYVTGKGLTVGISRLTGEFVPGSSAGIHWTGDSQTLSADRTVSRIRVTFSPNGGGELMKEDDAEFGSDPSPSEIDFNGNGSRMTYHSDYGSRADSTDASFTMWFGSGSGFASVVSATQSYFKIVPQFAGQEAVGVLSFFYKGHHAWSDGGLTKVDQGTTGVLFTTRRVYIPPVDSAGASLACILRLTLEMLLDVRYNPFEEANDDNEKGNHNTWKTHANYVYVPADVRLWDSETGGNVLYYYSNRGVAGHGETVPGQDTVDDNSYCSLANKMGGWVTGTAPSARSDARCWLSYYDQGAWDTRKNSSGILGWQGNRHNIGIARGDLMRDLREVPDGEYIPYPPRGGWIEVSVWGGVFMYDKIGDNNYSSNRVAYWLGRPDDTATTGVMHGLPSGLATDQISTDGVRWLLFRHPKLEIVENGVKRDVPDPGDEELTAWTSATAGEELSIDTDCGVLPHPVPNAHGQIYHIANATASPLYSIERGGRRARPEELLCGTLYSQYAERHAVLSGEASIVPGGLRTFTESNQGGKVFMLSGESQDCIEDTTEGTFVELSADGWDSSIFDQTVQQSKTFEAKTRKVKR